LLPCLAESVTNTTLVIGMVVVSIYVGYFGAGGGFLAMALFGFCGVHDIHEMNALKSSHRRRFDRDSIHQLHSGRACGMEILPGYGDSRGDRRLSGGPLQPQGQPASHALGSGHHRLCHRGYFFLQNYLIHP